MDLKQLTTFIQVAETGSLSKASDALRMAQPSLSRHIKMLEAEIGVELFVRHGRGMEPTEAGADLLKRVSGLVLQLEKTIEDVRSSSVEPRGHVTLGLFPTAVPILATRIMRRFIRELPQVSVRIAEGFPVHLIDWLQRGEIDVTLTIGPSADFHLRTIDLLFEDFVVAGSRDSGLSEGTPITMAQLANLPLIFPGALQRRGNPIMTAAEKAKVKLFIPFEVDSMPLTLSMVEGGLGYTVIPISAIAQDVENGRFLIAPLRNPKVRRQVLLALPTSRADTRATTAVANLVMDEIAELIRTGVWDAFPDAQIRAIIESKESRP